MFHSAKFQQILCTEMCISTSAKVVGIFIMFIISLLVSPDTQPVPHLSSSASLLSLLESGSIPGAEKD